MIISFNIYKPIKFIYKRIVDPEVIIKKVEVKKEIISKKPIKIRLMGMKETTIKQENVQKIVDMLTITIIIIIGAVIIRTGIIKNRYGKKEN